MAANVANKSQKRKAKVDLISATFKNITGGLLEYTKEYLPGASSIIEDSKEIFESVKKTSQNSAGSVLSTFKSISRLWSFKTLFDWYTDQGNQFGDDQSVGEDLGFDIGDMGSDDDSASETAKDVGNAEIEAMDKSSDKVSKTILDTSEQMAKLQVTSLSHITNSLEKTNSILTSGFENVKNAITDLTKVVSENTASLIKIVSVGREEEETIGSSREKFGMEQLLRGRFKLKDYFTHLKGKLSGSVGMLGMIPDMLQMFSGDPQMAMMGLQSFKSGWIKQGMEWGIEKLFPGFGKALRNLEKGVGQWFSDALISLGKGKNPFTGKQIENDWMRSVAEFFGVQGRGRSSGELRLKEFEQKKISFDTETKESIVKIIPGYLKDISVALGNVEKFYDFENRTWVTPNDIKREFKQQVLDIFHQNISTERMTSTVQDIEVGYNKKISQKEIAESYENNNDPKMIEIVHKIVDNLAYEISRSSRKDALELYDELKLDQCVFTFDNSGNINTCKLSAKFKKYSGLTEDDIIKKLTGNDARSFAKAINFLRFIKNDEKMLKRMTRNANSSAQQWKEYIEKQTERRFGTATNKDFEDWRKGLGTGDNEGTTKGILESSLNDNLNKQRQKQIILKGILDKELENEKFRKEILDAVNKKRKEKGGKTYTNWNQLKENLFTENGKYTNDAYAEMESLLRSWEYYETDDESYKDSIIDKIDKAYDKEDIDLGEFVSTANNVAENQAINVLKQIKDKNLSTTIRNLKVVKGGSSAPTGSISDALTEFGNNYIFPFIAGTDKALEKASTYFGDKYVLPVWDFLTSPQNDFSGIGKNINSELAKISGFLGTSSSSGTQKQYEVIFSEETLKKLGNTFFSDENLDKLNDTIYEAAGDALYVEIIEPGGIPVQTIEGATVPQVSPSVRNKSAKAAKPKKKWQPFGWFKGLFGAKASSPTGASVVSGPTSQPSTGGASATVTGTTTLATGEQVVTYVDQVIDTVSQTGKNIIKGLKENVGPTISNLGSLITGGEITQTIIGEDGKVIGEKKVQTEGLAGGIKTAFDNFTQNIFPKQEEINKITQFAFSWLTKPQPPKSKDPKKRKQEEASEKQRINLLTTALGAGLFAGGGPLGMLFGAMIGASAPISNLGFDFKEILFGDLLDKNADPSKPKMGVIEKTLVELVVPFKLEAKKTFQHVWMRFKMDILGPFQDIFAGFKGWVKARGGRAFRSIVDWYKKTPFYNWINKMVSGVIGWVKGIPKLGFNIVKTLAVKLLPGTVRAGVQSIFGAVGTIPKMIGGIFGKWFGDDFTKAMAENRRARLSKIFEGLQEKGNLVGMSKSERQFYELFGDDKKSGKSGYRAFLEQHPELQDKKKMEAAILEEKQKWLRNRTTFRAILFGTAAANTDVNPITDMADAIKGNGRNKPGILGFLEGIWEKVVKGKNGANETTVNENQSEPWIQSTGYLKLLEDSKKDLGNDAYMNAANYFKMRRVYQNAPPGEAAADNIADALRARKIDPGQAKALLNRLNAGKTDEEKERNNDIVNSAIAEFNIEKTDKVSADKKGTFFDSIWGGITKALGWVFSGQGLTWLITLGSTFLLLTKDVWAYHKDGTVKSIFDVYKSIKDFIDIKNESTTSNSLEAILMSKTFTKTGKLNAIKEWTKSNFMSKALDKAESIADLEKIKQEFLEEHNLKGDEKKAFEEAFDESAKSSEKFSKVYEEKEIWSKKSLESSGKIKEATKNMQTAKNENIKLDETIKKLQNKKAHGHTLSQAESTELTNALAKQKSNNAIIHNSEQVIIKENQVIMDAFEYNSKINEVNVNKIDEFKTDISSNAKKLANRFKTYEALNIRLAAVAGVQIGAQMFKTAIIGLANIILADSPDKDHILNLLDTCLVVVDAGSLALSAIYIINPKWFFGTVIASIFQKCFSNIIKFIKLDKFLEKISYAIKIGQASGKVLAQKEIETSVKDVITKSIPSAGESIAKTFSETAEKEVAEVLAKDAANVTFKQGSLLFKFFKGIGRCGVAIGTNFATADIVVPVISAVYGAANWWHVFEISPEICKMPSFSSLPVFFSTEQGKNRNAGVAIMSLIAAGLGLLMNTIPGMLIEIVADLFISIFRGLLPKIFFKAVPFKIMTFRGLLAWTIFLLINQNDWTGMLGFVQEFEEKLTPALTKFKMSRMAYIHGFNLTGQAVGKKPIRLFDDQGNTRDILRHAEVQKDTGFWSWGTQNATTRKMYNNKDKSMSIYKNEEGMTGVELDKEYARSLGVKLNSGTLSISNYKEGKDDNGTDSIFLTENSLADVNIFDPKLDLNKFDEENKNRIIAIRKHVAKVIGNHIIKYIKPDGKTVDRKREEKLMKHLFKGINGVDNNNKDAHQIDLSNDFYNNLEKGLLLLTNEGPTGIHSNSTVQKKYNIFEKFSKEYNNAIKDSSAEGNISSVELMTRWIPELTGQNVSSYYDGSDYAIMKNSMLDSLQDEREVRKYALNKLIGGSQNDMIINSKPLNPVEGATIEKANAAAIDTTLKKQEKPVDAKTKKDAETLEGAIDKKKVNKTKGLFGSPVGTRPLIISSKYGPRLHPIHGDMRLHNGVDIVSAQGEPLFAMTDGIITGKGFDSGGYGNWVTMKDPVSGYNYLYGHMAQPSNKNKGDKITKGMQVGITGSTGGSTGAHLHLTMMPGVKGSLSDDWKSPENNYAVNPEPIIKNQDTTVQYNTERLGEIANSKDSNILNKSKKANNSLMSLFGFSQFDDIISSFVNGFKGEEESNEGEDSSSGSIDSPGSIDTSYTGNYKYKDLPEGFKSPNIGDREKQIALIVYDELRKHGFSHTTASAVLGNLWQESTMDPGAYCKTAVTEESTGRVDHAEGLAQWVFGRKDNLIKFANKHGNGNWKDPSIQARFIAYELSQGNAFEPSGKKVYVSDLNKLNLKDATFKWRNTYERCGEHEAADKVRMEYAEYFNKAIGGSSKDLSIDSLIKNNKFNNRSFLPKLNKLPVISKIGNNLNKLNSPENIFNLFQTQVKEKENDQLKQISDLLTKLVMAVEAGNSLKSSELKTRFSDTTAMGSLIKKFDSNLKQRTQKFQSNQLFNSPLPTAISSLVFGV